MSIDKPFFFYYIIIRNEQQEVQMTNHIKNRKNSIVPDKFFNDVYKAIKDFTADEDEYNEFTAECQADIYTYIRDGWKDNKSIAEIADEIYDNVYMG